MKTILATLLLFPLAVSAAGVNKCIDANGRTVYQAAPCAGQPGEATDIETHGNKPAGLGGQAPPKSAMESLEAIREVNRRDSPVTATQQQTSSRPSLPNDSQLSAACGRKFKGHANADNIDGLDRMLRNRTNSRFADKGEIKELKCRLRYLYAARDGYVPERVEKSPEKEKESRIGKRYYDQQRGKWCQQIGSILNCY